MHFADIKNDIAFRKIFGNENRKDVLISFLNAILAFEADHKITEVEILNPYQLPRFRDGKATIIDVKARDVQGREFVVEMQLADVNGFSKRVLYYTSQSYTAQIERGEFYEDLKPVIFIGILDFILSAGENYLSRHQVREVETGEHLIKDVEFSFIELPKFKLEESDLKTLVEKWIFFIKNAENLEVIPLHVDDPALESAYKEANLQTWDKATLSAYDYASMREQDERGKITAAENRGIKEANRNAVIGLWQNGITMEIISKSLNVSLEEVNAIIAKHQSGK